MENNNYKYETTEAIVNGFKEAGLHFRVDSQLNFEIVEAGFPIEFAPGAVMRFISDSDQNDVAVRVLGLMTGVAKNKVTRILEACNLVNNTKRYMKYVLDSHGNVNVEYDFPIGSPTEFIAETCVKMFFGWAHNINDDYKVLINAAFTNKPLKIQFPRIPPALLAKLGKLEEKLKNIPEADDEEDEERILKEFFDTDFDVECEDYCDDDFDADDIEYDYTDDDIEDEYNYEDDDVHLRDIKAREELLKALDRIEQSKYKGDNDSVNNTDRTERDVDDNGCNQ